MCLIAAVGPGEKNLRDDVRTVRLLLNLNAPQIVGPLIADGICGSGTVAAIEMYQQNIIGGKDGAGKVPVGGTTLAALRAGMAAGLNEAKMEGIFIHAAAKQVSRFYDALLAGMKLGAIDTSLRQAHFLAQVAHESGELRFTEELATGEKYEGRKDLGNTQPGDGPRFKGRGLIQITGRTNYIALGKFVGRDLTVGDTMQSVAGDVQLAVNSAVWFWGWRKLNELADEDDVVAVTKKINGGLNGLDDRKVRLERAKFFLLDPYTDPRVAGMIQAMEAVGEDPVWEETPRQSGGRRRSGYNRRRS